MDVAARTFDWGRPWGKNGRCGSWTTWLDTYLDIVRKRNLIRQAVNRLAKPRQVQAFRHWQQDFLQSAKANAESSAVAKYQKDLLEERTKTASQDAELRRIKTESEQQIHLNKVALAEAEQAARDALARAAAEKEARRKEAEGPPTARPFFCVIYNLFCVAIPLYPFAM